MKDALTDFQKRVLETIEASPNSIANTWEIAWNGFAKEWEAKRSVHGALIRCILQAGQALDEKGLVVTLPGRDQWDGTAFGATSKWNRKEDEE